MIWNLIRLQFLLIIFFVSGCVSPDLANKYRPPLFKSSSTAESYKDFIDGYMEELKGRFDSAKFFYQRALKSDPGSSFLYLRIAELNLQQGDIDKAEKNALKAIDSNSENFRANFILGGLYNSSEKYSLAEKYYRKSVKLDSEHFESKLLLSSVLIEMKKYNQSLRLLNEIKEKRPGNVLILFYISKAYYLSGNFKQSQRNIIALLKINPNYKAGLFLLGSLYEKQGLFTQAQIIYKRFLKIVPNNQLARYRLGQLFIKEQNYSRAINEFESIKKETPGNMQIHSVLGILYYKKGNYTRALSEFRFVINKNPKDQEARLFVSRIYQRLGRIDSAKKELLSYLEIEGSDLEISLELSILYAKTENWKKAFYILNDMNRLYPQESRIDFLRGKFLSKKGEKKKAIKILKIALKKEPKNLQYLYYLATVYYETKMWKKVESEIKKILSIAPDNSNALNLLGYMYSELNIKINIAEELILKALKKEPNNPAFLDSIGWVYFRQGKFQEALEKVLIAFKKLPDDPVVLEHLGDIYLSLKKNKKAIFFWKQSIKKGSKDSRRIRKKIELQMKRKNND
tara:strand:- start:1810 stop:3522 length:1713 start_codon:yes stop_codon:yes gene_type:complete